MKQGKTPASEQDSAETLALQALSWLITQPEEFSAFQAASGANPADMASLAQSPAFLGAVLDFVLEADARVMAFCDAHGKRYDAPMQAKAVLAGPAAMNWT